MKTTMIRKEDVKPVWYLVDGEDMVVGRLATELATILMGKNKPTYTPHTDTGDYVVVTNCEKVVFTGRKWEQKMYRRHTGYLGGLVEELASDVLDAHPDRILRKAVQRMLPKTKLGRAMLDKLKIVEGTEHPFSAQQPKELKINAKRS